MTLLYYDPTFMEHETGTHPEHPARLRAVVQHLHFIGLDANCHRPSWEPATPEQLAAVHRPEYIQAVASFAAQGGGQMDPDTVVSSRSYEVARLAAGAAWDAVRRVLAGEANNAFCLSRPPGHHALPDRSMGFCLFNHVAVAARMAREQLDVARVLIVDWDVHHGNGTQDIFWEDGQVGFLSMHRSSFWPMTGLAEEVGVGPGEGTTLNVPIEFGTSRDAQLKTFERKLSQFAERIQPELVIISAGFDSHRADPIGSLGLESEDFGALTECVLAVADRYAEGRVVSVLEGGYNPQALTECVEVHLQALLDA